MMRVGMSLLAALALCAANATVAYADPPPWAHGHDRYDDHDHDDHDHDDHDRHDHWDGRHDHEDHHDHGHYVRERVVVRERIYVMPWRRAAMPAPYGIAEGTCNRQLLGAVVGGGAGAAIGSTIGKGTGRLVAVAGGAILGFLAGGAVGQAMDEVDQNCIGQALEHADNGRSVVWRDPANNQQYTVSPVQTFQAEDGRYCREYTTAAVVAGKRQQVYGTACRQPDGSWQIVG
jgi:surface antigen